MRNKKMLKERGGFPALPTEISRNLSMAKGFAAIVVMLGHYTNISNFWVIQTIALLIFTISSGLFTRQRYNGGFSKKEYWDKKLVRLGPHLVTIYLLLFCLFLVRGEKGLWSWYTLVNLAGMNGFLNWFHIHNQSPYGHGMWFLTLLLIFYTIYPFLDKIYSRRRNSYLFTVSAISFLFIAHRLYPYGHSLWLTAGGYLVGILIIQEQIKKPALFLLVIFILGCICLLITHFVLEFDAANFWFILGLATVIILFCMNDINVPIVFSKIGIWLSSIALEIYLLHPYLQVKPTQIILLDIVISIVIVLFVSYFVSKNTRLILDNIFTQA